MKKPIILVAMILAAAAFSNVEAQVTPPGAGDKDLRDTNVKGRSNELERIDREARKSGKRGSKDRTPQSSKTEQPEDALATKYEEIKLDFEQIQKSQDSIITSYKSGEKVDYAQIGKSALEIKKSATRLNSNLFPPPVKNLDEKKVDNAEKQTKKSKTIRDIIVELDNTIGSFAASPMFQNLRTPDPEVAGKTKIDLARIIEFSEILAAEAEKMIKIK